MRMGEVKEICVFVRDEIDFLANCSLLNKGMELQPKISPREKKISTELCVSLKILYLCVVHFP